MHNLRGLTVNLPLKGKQKNDIRSPGRERMSYNKRDVLVLPEDLC